ncbi:hypothetical protein H6P81_013139 [Aristolochia fimbriata]|uniref:Uncharacterized protein n=1 Tax=Aristolochia fimbriata TaxID=158543 RepID=A0AAV7EGQ4_ARIFI|nr:hypothetical protein H6P81_013139 [Aristolochia fimbriata]
MGQKSPDLTERKIKSLEFRKVPYFRRQETQEAIGVQPGEALESLTRGVIGSVKGGQGGEGRQNRRLEGAEEEVIPEIKYEELFQITKVEREAPGEAIPGEFEVVEARQVSELRRDPPLEKFGVELERFEVGE